VNAPLKTTTDAAICIADLTVRKGERTICQLTDATVSKSSRVGVTGLNGSGKTTLLRVLAGLETDFTGTLELDVPLAERVFVHQSPFLFSGTVLNNVEYGLRARSVPRSERRELASFWLKQLGILDFANRSARSLSGGEARRTALARACILRPGLLLLDEPLADLDPAGAECVLQAFDELSESTILISSPTPLAVEFAQTTIRLGQSVN